jgi:1-deoxy-D-xylulose-5-phosphate synthase
MRIHGIPQEFLDHAKREAILERVGLTAQTIALDTITRLGALDAVPAVMAAPVES